MTDEPRPGFLTRLRIKNYKSIADCDVAFGRLTLLIGRNGSGKSNVVDALRFVADSLTTSLDHAFVRRGGVQAVRRMSTGHPRNFSIQMEFVLRDRSRADYGFELRAVAKGYEVKQERLRIMDQSMRPVASYEHCSGQVRSSVDSPPAASADRLYLVTASGRMEFRAVFDELCSMGFYNVNPDVMRAPQAPDAGLLLARDGRNVASVLGRLADEDTAAHHRVNEFLGAIVPGVTAVVRAPLGPLETLEFRQEVEGSGAPWKFNASNMSDGTLRALGNLVAVSQRAVGGDRMRLVGIEEPEAALHPAAAAALVDALDEAADRTQILVTSHSPDLLDAIADREHELLVVSSVGGVSRVGPMDPASKEAIRDHLYSAGDLLRMDQLEPEPSLFDQPGSQA